MSRMSAFRRALHTASVALILASTPALAQATKTFEPSPGQQGKDVIWLPTAQALVDRMLDMAKVTKSDFVVDLGSGDGRTVITAAKRGVRALGVEYNPDMVALSRETAKKEGVSELAEFVQADIFEYDFSRATVVTLFLLPQLNVRLRPTILSMKPGTRVVSNSFDMGDWTPDEKAEAKGDCTSYCRAMLWIVPAKVDGVWNMPGGRLELTQTYQMITGTLTQDGVRQPVSGSLAGDEIAFQAGGRKFSGRVTEVGIEGQFEGVNDRIMAKRGS